MQAVPDVPNFGWVEYGLRCGLPRMLELLRGEAFARARASMRASSTAYPAVAEAVLAAGWELVAHGVVQRALTAEEDEAAVIGESIAAIAAFTGTAPRGWLGPGLQQTSSTPDLLKQHGIDYVSTGSWTTCRLGRNRARPAVAVPYSLELNDSILHAVERHPSDELPRRLQTTLATYESELPAVRRESSLSACTRI